MRTLHPRIVAIAFLSNTLLLVGGHAQPIQDGSDRQNMKSVSAKPSVSITEKNGKRLIESNGIPNHSTGQFPNRGNPNAISPQNHKLEMPLQPVENSTFTVTKRQPIGVAVNGVLFEPGTAEFWKNNPTSGWHMEAIGGLRNLGLDQNLAHVQPTGAYHYHGIPEGLITKETASGNEMILLGWAADGFPIYGPMAHADAMAPKSDLRVMKPSYRLKQGQRPGGSVGPGGNYNGDYTEDFEFVDGSGDLDEANGRRGVTPEYPSGTYYYVATGDFPFLPRMFKGTPDPSFSRTKGGGRGMRQNRRSQGPPPDSRPPGMRPAAPANR